MTEVAIHKPTLISVSPEQTLPELRRDIHLYSGPSTADGAPTWTLYDPARNLFFRIGWTEFEMLSRWHLRNAGAVIRTVNRETTLNINEMNIRALVQFLVINNLVIKRLSAYIGHCYYHYDYVMSLTISCFYHIYKKCI